MPLLTNPRHEKFAHGLASGMTQLAAYEAAGYKPDTGAAARLVKNVSICQRVAEITAPAREKAQVDAEYVYEHLRRQIERDDDKATHAGCVSALKLAAQLAGLLIERRDNTHQIEPDVLKRRRERIEEHVLELSDAG